MQRKYKCHVTYWYKYGSIFKIFHQKHARATSQNTHSSRNTFNMHIIISRDDVHGCIPIVLYFRIRSTLTLLIMRCKFHTIGTPGARYLVGVRCSLSIHMFLEGARNESEMGAPQARNPVGVISDLKNANMHRIFQCCSGVRG